MCAGCLEVKLWQSASILPVMKPLSYWVCYRYYSVKWHLSVSMFYYYYWYSCQNSRQRKLQVCRAKRDAYVALQPLLLHSIHGQQSGQSESCCDKAVDDMVDKKQQMEWWWRMRWWRWWKIHLFSKYMKVHKFSRELKHGYTLQSAYTCCVVHLFSSTAELQ